VVAEDRPEGPAVLTMDVLAALRTAILEKIPDANVDVQPGSGGGHYTIAVVSPVFAGKNMVDSQRLVYGAIAHLMKGNDAPVHAVDKLTTKTP
jgi:acid stress-induced BolA-like protein IbaG/YrbA